MSDPTVIPLPYVIGGLVCFLLIIIIASKLNKRK